MSDAITDDDYLAILRTQVATADAALLERLTDRALLAAGFFQQEFERRFPVEHAAWHRANFDE